MATKYYLKELVSKPAFDRHGRQIPFQTFGGDYGGIALDTDNNGELIEDLEKMASEHVGGILRSTEGEHSAKKALPLHQPTNPRAEIRLFNPPKQSPQPGQPQPGAGVAAVEGALPPLAPMPRIDPGSEIAPQGSQPAPTVLGKEFKPKMGRPGVKKTTAPPPPDTPAAT